MISKDRGKTSKVSKATLSREGTLALVRSRKTVAEMAQMRHLTEGTILKHLELIRSHGKLLAQDLTYLWGGSEEAMVEIHAAFRELGTEKLSPVFEKLQGAYSYDTLRLARLLFET